MTHHIITHHKLSNNERSDFQRLAISDRALRDMAYINCTSKQSDDEPYRYTSPSVILQSLKEGVYGPLSARNIYGYSKADKISREDALALYRCLTFDKETGWSTLLIGLQKSATPFEGSDRMFRNEGCF